MGSESERNFYQVHPTTCAPDDYWGQVRRTVNGKPIPERQIELIVDSTAENLGLAPDDRLLDLCCGNGALTTRWFARCAGGLGVDFSEPLIQVARSTFSRGPHEAYVLASVLDFAADPTPFGAHLPCDVAVSYGSLQYLPRVAAAQLLADLARTQPSLRRVVLGNVPDRERLEAFRLPGVEIPLDDPDSAIGCWWSVAELSEVAKSAGFALEARHMPDEFYSAHYRFDALLTPL